MRGHDSQGEESFNIRPFPPQPAAAPQRGAYAIKLSSFLELTLRPLLEREGMDCLNLITLSGEQRIGARIAGRK